MTDPLTSLGIVPEPVVFSRDPRDPCWGTPGFPDWVTSFRDHQWDAFVAITNHYAAGADVVLVDAPVGCLSGDTLIGVNRGGKGFKITLHDLHEKLLGRKDRGKSWDLSISTRVAQGDMESMTVRSSLVEAVTCSGMKETLDVGVGGPRGERRSLRLTPDHKVMTPDGWKPAGTLAVGDQVLVNSGRAKTSGPRAKRYYPYTSRLIGHPRRSSTDDRVPNHILVVEAHDNGLTLDGYVERLRRGDADFKFVLWPEMHVHHKNGDTEDYRLDNLEVIPASDHQAHHGDATCVAERLTWRSVRNIESAGPTMTYDITMAEGGEHFMADGIYVHNSGKTLLADMVQRWKAVNTLYVCSGKALQDQFVADFPYARVLKGRSNYPTADHPELHPSVVDGDSRFVETVSAADCDLRRAHLPACSSCPRTDTDMYADDTADEEFPHCSECHPVSACPHGKARSIAMAARIACVNTSYLLAEANTSGRISRRSFIVVDECDMLEKELMSYFEVNISSWRREKLDIPFPIRKTETAGTRTRYDDDGDEYTDWENWFDEAMTKVRTRIVELPARSTDRKKRKERESLKRLLGRLDMVSKSITNGSWVYTGGDRGEIVFKPVTVSEFGADVLWKHGTSWMLMSGTIIDPTEMVESLGIPETMRWEVVTVPMMFPVENRPIKILPTAEMSAKNKEEAWPKMAKRLREIAEHHPDDRILVHSVSYALTQFLVDHLPRDRTVTYSGAADREHALAAYREKPGAILVGPSMDRGVDLPGDLCRVMVICKLPFPYLGDKQISTRLYATRGGQTWYLIQCIRSFVQMTGRGVRNDTDHAVVYVLDKAFQNNIWKKGRKLLPKYMVEAIDWSGRL